MRALETGRTKKPGLDFIFVVFFVLYPMRHIFWGLDLWDTGYNYANFSYMGLEHMDPMWLFSTYLATAVGHLLTLLPGAGTLAGMNCYTSLFAGGLAVGGYLFCTRKLGIPQWIAFAGEVAALSLCWCPTAVLYNYITYVFFLGCVVFLYKGLTEERMGYLFAAGVCLGCNVLVRFSNLPEAAMIVAVWAWDFIVWREERRREDYLQSGTWRQSNVGSSEEIRTDRAIYARTQPGEVSGSFGSTFGGQIVRHTLWCLGGYLAALAVLLSYIHLRYGLDAYFNGISRLFAMTDSAQGYKPTSMIADIVNTYVQNLYWASRICVIILAGVAGFAVLEMIRRKMIGQKSAESGGVRISGDIQSAGIWNVIWRLAQIGWCGVAVLMPVWLHLRNFCSLEFYTYGPVERPAVLFLMLTLLIGVVRIFHPQSPREEKLISGILILVILLTPIGSNNRLFPSFNNLFVAAPYALWQCWRFLKHVKGWKVISAFPVKAVMVSFLAMFFVQSTIFGACFLFTEGTGAQNITAVIENNEVLSGIKMDPQRAAWMEEISAYANRESLQGREVILFGQLPALSFYLRMPSAFNPWCDLPSYSYDTMEAELEKLAEGIELEGKECPVVIVDREYAKQYEWYREGGEELLREKGVSENQIVKIVQTEKKYWRLQGFMEGFNYDLTYENGKFRVYRARSL